MRSSAVRLPGIAASADLGELPPAGHVFTEEVGFDRCPLEPLRGAPPCSLPVSAAPLFRCERAHHRKADAGIVNLDVAQVRVYGCTRTTAATYKLSRSSCRRAASALPIPALEPVRERLQARALAALPGTGWEQIGQFSTIILSAKHARPYKIKDGVPFSAPGEQWAPYLALSTFQEIVNLRLFNLFVRTLRIPCGVASLLLRHASYIRRAAPACTPGCPWAWGTRRSRTSSAKRWTYRRAGDHFPAHCPTRPYEATSRWDEYGDIARLKGP